MAGSLYGTVSGGDLRIARFPEEIERGIATPKRDIDLIRRRLAEVERLHRERQN